MSGADTMILGESMDKHAKENANAIAVFWNDIDEDFEDKIADDDNPVLMLCKTLELRGWQLVEKSTLIAKDCQGGAGTFVHYQKKVHAKSNFLGRTF